jgi:hypothetical protein
LIQQGLFSPRLSRYGTLMTTIFAAAAFFARAFLARDYAAMGAARAAIAARILRP